MNSNKILKVYANSKKSELGLGDYIRIASFLPNLNFKKIYWYSNKELFPIIKKIDFIDKVYDLKKREKIATHPKKIKVINLYENGKNDYENLYIKNFFQKKRDIKNNTINIYDKFANFYNIKKYKIFTNSKQNYRKSIDIFFNWSAPTKWKKKQLPKKKWQKLENLIKKKYKRIVWQNPDDNLEKYIKKIQRSKFVISIVGLGNHLSTLFNIPTIILCGPTFFNEAKKHKNVNLIYPNNPCGNKSCKVIKKLNHCGRMDHIKLDDILKRLKL